MISDQVQKFALTRWIILPRRQAQSTNSNHWGRGAFILIFGECSGGGEINIQVRSVYSEGVISAFGLSHCSTKNTQTKGKTPSAGFPR